MVYRACTDLLWVGHIYDLSHRARDVWRDNITRRWHHLQLERLEKHTKIILGLRKTRNSVILDLKKMNTVMGVEL